MSKCVQNALIIKQEQLADDVFSMVLEAKTIAKQAQPGQFISLYCKDKAHLLPRPISLCEVDGEKGLLRIVYRTVGFGTKEFATYKAGDFVKIIGPLGHGFPLIEEKEAILFGGGIGIPPMLELAKQLNTKTTIVLGYRDTLFMQEDFLSEGTVLIATEDGSVGTKGNVLNAAIEQDIFDEQSKDTKVIYACGPMPMLRAIKAFAEERNITCYLSLEEKMACGIGACLACVCDSKEKDEHSNVYNKRICAEGPVFLSTEVEL